jgi:hypothetical protein
MPTRNKLQKGNDAFSLKRYMQIHTYVCMGMFLKFFFYIIYFSQIHTMKFLTTALAGFEPTIF